MWTDDELLIYAEKKLTFALLTKSSHQIQRPNSTALQKATTQH
jgi:hypothetical protein